MANTLGEIFIRNFVRYFIPGAVFYLVVVFLPLQLFFEAALKPVNLASAEVIILGSLIFGYLLDSIGAYAWHSKRAAYLKEKTRLVGILKHASRLSILQQEPQLSDPDFYSICLWLEDEELYDRITAERAEWVAILESAFSLSIGAFLVFIGILVEVIFLGELEALWFSLLSTAMVIASNLAAKKGIQRMRIHDAKLIAAVKLEAEEQLTKYGGTTPKA